jgi:hypothetical protein
MNEFLVAASHGPGGPLVLGAGSQFHVAWTDVNAQNLNAATFDLGGSKVNEFQINTTQGITGFPSIAPMMGGGLIASWMTGPPAKLVFQRVDPSGHKVGSEVVVSTNVMTSNDRFTTPAIGYLIDGKFVISWVSAMPDTGAQVRAAMFSPDGAKIGNEIAVSTSAGIHYFPAIATFDRPGNDDIAFVIAWTGGPGGVVSSRFQLFNIDGSKAGGEVVPRQFVGQIAAASFPSPPDPREFVSVSTDQLGEAVLVVARLFNRAGNSLQTDVSHRVDNTTATGYRVVDIGSKAVVTWTQRPLPTTDQFGTRVMAAVLDVVRSSQDGVVVSQQQTPIATTNGGGQNSLSASPVSDDSGEKIAFAWADGRMDGSQSVIKARVTSLALT